MSSLRRFRPLTFSVMAMCGIALTAGQQGVVTGPFTAEQAANGRSAYQTHCASCHRPDLRGSGEASPLAGGNFMTAWADRSAHDLFERIQGSMPPGAAGTLGRANLPVDRGLHPPGEWRVRRTAAVDRQCRSADRLGCHRPAARASGAAGAGARAQADGAAAASQPLAREGSPSPVK